MTARAVDLEIVERVRKGRLDPMGVVVPNEIRINGQEVLAPLEHPVIVHEQEINGTTAAYVTLTLFVRSLTIRQAEEFDPAVD